MIICCVFLVIMHKEGKHVFNSEHKREKEQNSTMAKQEMDRNNRKFIKNSIKNNAYYYMIMNI